MNLNMIKKLVLALLLGSSFAQAGSWAEYNEYVRFQEKRGVNLEEYQELICDCRAIRHILERILNGQIDLDLLETHINAYLLDAVGSHTAQVLYEDLCLIDFNL